MKQNRIGSIALATGLAALAAYGIGCREEEPEDAPWKVSVARDPVNNGEKWQINEVGYKWLESQGVTKKEVLEYDERFQGSPRKILEMHRLGGGPEFANAYDKRFSVDEVMVLRLSNVFPAIANGYSPRFKADAINFFQTSEIPSKKANEYPTNLNKETIRALNWSKVSGEEYKKYNGGRFNCWDIERLLQEPKISLDVARQYSKEFSGADIRELRDKKISPNDANKYSYLMEDKMLRVCAGDIAFFISSGYSEEEVNKAARDVRLKNALGD